MYHPNIPPKRRKDTTVPNTPPRNRLTPGQLHLLPSVPLDIVHEILGFLWPGDLLALSRTSKAFRSLLMSSSATFLWSAARQNASWLPDPPSDLNEIQYAVLTFGTECSNQGCHRRARHTIWHLRIRLCGSCRTNHKPVLRESKDWDMIRAILHCSPLDLNQYLPRGPFLTSKGNRVEGFHGSQLKAFREGLQTISASEREDYLARHRQDTEAITKHTALAVEWQLQVKQERQNQLDVMRIARTDMIRKMLVEAGFSEEIEYFTWERISGHQDLSFAHTARVLEKLQEYMNCWRELLREERVYSARRGVFAKAWFQFTSAFFVDASPESPYLPLPPTASIGLFPPIDSLIRQPGDVRPEFLFDQLYNVFEPACDYILQWHKGVRRELAILLPDYKPDDDDEEIHTRLKLAISVFRCTASKRCQLESRALTYPEMLSHPCFWCPPFSKPLKDPLGRAKQLACAAMGGANWSWQSLVQAHPKREEVVNIVTCCGKDLQSTTIAEMDVEDPRVMCVLCLNGGVPIFMNWRVAVQHSSQIHPIVKVDDGWRSAPPAMLACLRQFESRSRTHVNEQEHNMFNVCLLCPRGVTSWCSIGPYNLIEHFSRHGITDAVRGCHFESDNRINPHLPAPIEIRVPLPGDVPLLM